ncbi:MAG: DUF6458 family protein [Actinomycetota bacterium]|nr:DUF6458 family protein [Actinomycetota bacterium]
MTIGGSIALIIIGAILAFAVEFDVAGIEIQTIGVILMIGGLIGLVFGLAMVYRTRAARGSVVEERRVTNDRDVY